MSRYNWIILFFRQIIFCWITLQIPKALCPFKFCQIDSYQNILCIINHNWSLHWSLLIFTNPYSFKFSKIDSYHNILCILNHWSLRFSPHICTNPYRFNLYVGCNKIHIPSFTFVRLRTITAEIVNISLIIIIINIPYFLARMLNF